MSTGHHAALRTTQLSELCGKRTRIVDGAFKGARLGKCRGAVGSEAEKWGAVENVAGERGVDGDMQTECPAREFGPGSCRHPRKVGAWQ